MVDRQEEFELIDPAYGNKIIKEDDSFLVIGKEEGCDVISPDSIPQSKEEKELLNKTNLVIENSKVTNIDIKHIAGFSKEGINLMADASNISYLSRTINEEKLKKQGFKTPEDFKELGYKITDIEDLDMKTKCSIISKGDEVYIAFRGTKNTQNMFSDANTFLSTSSFMKGRVHKGFYNVFKGLWPKVRSELVDIADKNNTKIEDLKYTFTGHSMGRAVAKIAAMYVNNEYKAKDIGVVTFGDPRVFDSKQAKEYNKDLGDKTLRVVRHHHDPVPAGIPGSTGYSHVGCQLRVEPEKGVVHSLSGYKYGVRQLDDKSMVDSKSVSIFYTPSLLLRKLNEKTFGNIQQAVKSIRSHMGSKGWAEKEAQDLRSQKDTKPKMQR